jgi:thioester reductase-like protein
VCPLLRFLLRPSLERLTAIVRSSSAAATLPAILKSLNPAADTTKVRLVISDVTHATMGLTQRIDGPSVTSIIHGAAFTKFKA